MNRFLSLFRAYRDLEAQLADSAARAIESDDQSRLWRSRCEMAESDKEKARATLEHALKTTANYEALRSGSPYVPYPDVHVAPLQQSAPAASDPASPPKRSAREFQHEAVMHSRKSAQERRRLAVMDNGVVVEAAE